MARLGDVSFFITDESHGYSNTVTDHPVEDGSTISDHVENDTVTFSVNGQCTGENAGQQHLALKRLWRDGEPETYVGRGRLTTVIIEKLDTDRDSGYAKGFSFSMTLKQVRIARTSTVDLLSPDVKAQVKDVGDAGRVQPA